MKNYTTLLARLGCALLAGLISLPATASAQVIYQTGTISNVYVADAQNYAFRVQLYQNGANQLSECPGSFAYVNKDHNNYDAYVASLLTRYVQGKPVAMYIYQDQSNFCFIGEFNM